MSPAEIRSQLLRLARQRAAAERSGIAAGTDYAALLDARLVAYRKALAGAMVTELAVGRGEQRGRRFG